MKKIILIASIIVVVCQAKAQETHKYINSTTEVFNKDHSLIVETYSSNWTGNIYLSKHLLKINWKHFDRQVYAIAQAGKYEAADEGYYTKVLLLLAPCKNGLKPITAVLLVDSKFRLTDLIIKNSDTVNTTYTIRKLQFKQSMSATLKRD